jgi:hypothetical protein
MRAEIKRLQMELELAKNVVAATFLQGALWRRSSWRESLPRSGRRNKAVCEHRGE